MSLWRVALFDHRGDKKPSRIGYLFADTHKGALEIASAAKANGARIDVTLTTMRPAQMDVGSKEIHWDGVMNALPAQHVPGQAPATGS